MSERVWAGRIRTDAATVCCFDLELIRHRVADRSDWWTSPNAAATESEQGNALFMNLGGDGTFEVTVNRCAEMASEMIMVGRLRCESGSIYLVSGENCPSEGLVPDLKYGGAMLTVGAGVWGVAALLKENNLRVDMWREPEWTPNPKKPSARLFDV